MELLPFEIAKNHIIKTLSYEDILHFCGTKNEYASICQDKSMWANLLKRDFDAVCDPQESYLTYKSALKFLSTYLSNCNSTSIKGIC
jgi:hypothetical protein